MNTKHLGWRQQQILDALVVRPHTTTELDARMDDPGPISISLTRSALNLLEERGLVRRQCARHRAGRPIVWERVRVSD